MQQIPILVGRKSERALARSVLPGVSPRGDIAGIARALHKTLVTGHHRRTMARLPSLRFAFLAFGVLILSLGRAATPADTLTSRLERIAETEAARQAFMGAVLVTRDGTTLLDKAYGSANLEWNVANTSRTRFRIGSITKQFTAAAMLLLEERGKLKLGDRVAVHLPAAPAAWENITLYQLLTHTSGIPNITSLPEFRVWRLSPMTPAQALQRLRDLPLDFAPGEKFAYSNSNYLLLGLVVERVSGQDYATFLRDNILDPLGLFDTGIDSHSDLLQFRAAGYARRGERLLNAPYVDMSVPHAAGAMYSTTHDLRHWIEALLAGKLVSAASLERMLTPEKNAYALGLIVRVVGGRKVIQHGGGIEGFSAFLAHYPDDKTTIVVLANIMGRVSEPLARQFASAIFGGPAAR